MAARSEKKFVDGLILERGERATIPPFEGLDVDRPMTVHVIAQSHIDIIWYWPIAETVRMVLETFRGHADLLEADASLTFCQSQVALFEMVRAEDPALFERIVRLVQEGRWEMVGGEWVEPAVSIGGPEVHARQFLVGQRYLQEHFGVRARVGWAPDSFVLHCDCFPQLLRQAGIGRFVHKRPREKYMMLPTLPYRWRGNDGSEVLTLRTTNKGMGIPILSDGSTAPSDKGDAAYIADTFNARGISHLWGPLGVGDIGGVNHYVLPEVPGPLRAEFDTATGYFDALEEEIDNATLPHVEGVLGPIFTGCLTTWAHVKTLNRRAENTIQQVEFLKSACRALDVTTEATDLDALWRRLLLLHFHDTVAGVGTEDVQREVEQEFRQVVVEVERVRQRCARRLAESVRSDDTDGLPVVVFNPMGHRRTDVVETRLSLRDAYLAAVPAEDPHSHHHEIDAYGYFGSAQFEAVDDDGNATPVMIERFARLQRRTYAHIRMVVQDVPPFGYRTWQIRRCPPSAPTVRIDGTTIETDRLRVEFDPIRGGIDVLEDRSSGVTIEADGLPLGALCLHDTGKYDLNYGQEHNQWEAGLTGRVNRLRPHDFRISAANGDRVLVNFDYRFGESTLGQTYLIEPSVSFVTMRVEGRFHEVERYCKAHFSVHDTETAAADLPYGYTPNLPEGVEYAMQYGAAVLGPKHGLAILNRGRYGCLWRDDELSISLVRCATFPAWISDRGPFETELRLMALGPDDGDRQQRIIRAGYDANLALFSYAPERSEQRLDRTWSLTGAPIDDVLGVLAKPCEDGDGVALRLYNGSSEPRSQSMNAPVAFPSMVASNIIEDDLGADGALPERGTLEFRPHEIRTLVCKNGV
ncbi:MAG: hypothetical protein CMJ18_00280 [Phycisphaeraceae bacterium]|nr:hypothetical protein [Phycisphaeraceae bacterium]